jgi:hypothetical protein
MKAYGLFLLFVIVAWRALLFVLCLRVFSFAKSVESGIGHSS